METLNTENFEQQDLPFKVNRISPNIGAELLEIDLKEDFDEKTYEFIYQALLIYKVIFFRKQNLSTGDHLRFAKNLVNWKFILLRRTKKDTQRFSA